MRNNKPVKSAFFLNSPGKGLGCLHPIAESGRFPPLTEIPLSIGNQSMAEPIKGESGHAFAGVIESVSTTDSRLCESRNQFADHTSRTQHKGDSYTAD